ncbi:50S ribosomal protein L15 [Candidatus Johnevansia muelleri]|uniref:Large ribosomal subunit protein uL15 n=1 Tax=Candidatus Johnevansia muelleri TaxID=1495769 RepID=A0A078KB30_9GAMM|nr:50S ribosomal protein L15 [Candidatus Evansia muelleri]
MKMNTLHPLKYAKNIKTRVGRGIGSGLGKTAGRGHKGFKSRSGGKINLGFEGGQMPIQRRIPKFGFISFKNRRFEEVRISDIMKSKCNIINIEKLKKINIIKNNKKLIKIIYSKSIEKSVITSGIKLTKGARIAIEKFGGKVK